MIRKTVSAEEGRQLLMRRINRSLVAAATALPLMLGASGVAVADTTDSDPVVDADADVTMHEDGNAKGDAHVEPGYHDNGYGNDDENDGILEELLGGLLGDDDNNGDHGYDSDDSVLGIL
jgi:hypothetical protein